MPCTDLVDLVDQIACWAISARGDQAEAWTATTDVLPGDAYPSCRGCGAQLYPVTGQPGVWTDGAGFTACIKAQMLSHLMTGPRGELDLAREFGRPVPHIPMPTVT